MRHRLILTLAALAALTALVVTSVVQAAPDARKRLSGFDGPGFVIGMSKRTVAHGQFGSRSTTGPGSTISPRARA